MIGIIRMVELAAPAEKTCGHVKRYAVIASGKCRLPRTMDGP